MACPEITDDLDLLAGYPTFNIDVEQGVSVVTCRYVVEWDALRQLFTNLYDTDFQLDPLSTLRAVMPAYWSGDPRFRLQSLSVNPVGGERAQIIGQNDLFNAEAFNEYEAAEVNVDYGIPQWQTDGEGDPLPYLRHTQTASMEFMTVGANDWVWEADNAPVGDGVGAGLIVPTVNHQIDFPLITKATMPFAVIEQISGSVNGSDFAFRTHTATAETLLFLGADYKEVWLLNGELAYQLSYMFAETKGRTDSISGAVAGWNHFWRDDGDKTGWYRVEHSNRGMGPTNPYDVYNFDNLFGK